MKQKILIFFMLVIGLLFYTCDTSEGLQWPPSTVASVTSVDSNSILLSWDKVTDNSGTTVKYYGIISDRSYCTSFEMHYLHNNEFDISEISDDSLANTFFDTVLDVGTNTSCLFTGLESKKKYYFTVCSKFDGDLPYISHNAWDSATTK